MFADVSVADAANTLSIKLLICNVSCAVSKAFVITYVQEYGFPIAVGPAQPFENPIPWIPTARAPPTPNASSTDSTARPIDARARSRRRIPPPISGHSSRLRNESQALRGFER